MRHLLKNRFLLSCLILIVAVLFLKPYLTSTRGRRLPSRIEIMEVSLAPSVERVLTLAQALTDAREDLGLLPQEQSRAGAELDALALLVRELEDRLEDMDSGADELPPQAAEAFQALQRALADLIFRSPQAGEDSD